MSVLLLPSVCILPTAIGKMVVSMAKGLAMPYAVSNPKLDAQQVLKDPATVFVVKSQNQDKHVLCLHSS